MNFFIGRKDELQRLNRTHSLKKAALTVVKGRRRVGKSTLVQEFAKNKTFISLSGHPPLDDISPQKQRDEFGSQLCSQLHLPRVTFLSWSDAFRFLSEHIGDKDTVLLFDEVTWMAGSDSTFLASLKTFWDTVVNKKPHLMLVLCSSISIWMEENILCSTGFFGRISLVIHLQPLSLPESILFLKKRGFKGSLHEIFKILSVTGGVPWYLDLIHPKETADQNIYELCFQKESQLLNEFQTIFHDLFDKKGDFYRKILETLIDGMKTQREIQVSLSLERGGTAARYLKNLVLAGFLSEHYQWSLKTGRLNKTKLYRLSDCYIRFHLKYVRPHQDQIKQGLYKKTAKGHLPGCDTIMGFQMESLLLSNRDLLFKAIGIDSALSLCDNPFFQKPTTRQRGCQIDYLIQTKLNSLIICEFKFSRHELGSSIIKEMETKCNALAAPKGFGKAPVLFHMGDVSPPVEESSFFYRVIDLRSLFEAVEEEK